MDKAPDFGSGDCRFESCHGRRFCIRPYQKRHIYAALSYISYWIPLEQIGYCCKRFFSCISKNSISVATICNYGVFVTKICKYISLAIAIASAFKEIKPAWSQVNQKIWKNQYCTISIQTNNFDFSSCLYLKDNFQDKILGNPSLFDIPIEATQWVEYVLMDIGQVITVFALNRDFAKCSRQVGTMNIVPCTLFLKNCWQMMGMVRFAQQRSHILTLGIRDSSCYWSMTKKPG